MALYNKDINMEHEMTDTEILTRINSLKTKHELLKRELIDLTVVMENKENEMLEIESEYAALISKII